MAPRTYGALWVIHLGPTQWTERADSGYFVNLSATRTDFHIQCPGAAGPRQYKFDTVDGALRAAIVVYTALAKPNAFLMYHQAVPGETLNAPSNHTFEASQCSTRREWLDFQRKFEKHPEWDGSPKNEDPRRQMFARVEPDDVEMWRYVEYGPYPG